MVSEHLNELYKNVPNPFEDIERLMQSEEYKLWQKHLEQKQQKTPPSFSSPLERLTHFLEANAQTLLVILLVFAGILAFLYLLGKFSQKSISQKEAHTVRVLGKITNISLRTPNTASEEKFFRHRHPEKKPYAMVEFTYNGFRYTKGFYLPKSPEYKVGNEVTLLLNPKNVNDSSLLY